MSGFALQAIGFFGVALFVVSYQLRSNRALFFCQLAGCIVFCVQFFLMGAYTGALSLIVNILRNLLLLRRREWKWAGGRAALFAILVLLAATSIGYWSGNARKIRVSQLIGSPCTLLYDLIVRSFGGALSEGITIVSILVSIRRFGWRALDTQQ